MLSAGAGLVFVGRGATPWLWPRSRKVGVRGSRNCWQKVVQKKLVDWVGIFLEASGKRFGRFWGCGKGGESWEDSRRIALEAMHGCHMRGKSLAPPRRSPPALRRSAVPKSLSSRPSSTHNDLPDFQTIS